MRRRKREGEREREKERGKKRKKGQTKDARLGKRHSANKQGHISYLYLLSYQHHLPPSQSTNPMLLLSILRYVVPG